VLKAKTNFKKLKILNMKSHNREWITDWWLKKSGLEILRGDRIDK